MTKVYLGATGLAFMLMASFFALQNTSQSPARSLVARAAAPRVAGAEVHMAIDPVTGYTLTVTKAGTGSGTVTTNLGLINCGSVCGASLASGANPILYAQADAGSTFTSWSGDCTPDESPNSCFALMNGAKSVTATFSLTVASPTITTLPATDIKFNSASLDADVNLRGVAAAGWFRYATTNPGTCNDSFGTKIPSSGLPLSASTDGFSSTVPSLAPTTTYYYCAILQSASSMIFGQVVSFSTTTSTTYSVAVNPSGVNGNVVSYPTGINCFVTNGNSSGICGANFSAGTTVTLTATPLSGGSFSGWSTATYPTAPTGGCSGTSPTCTLTMNHNYELGAVFSATTTTGPIMIYAKVNGSEVFNGGNFRLVQNSNNAQLYNGAPMLPFVFERRDPGQYTFYYTGGGPGNLSRISWNNYAGESGSTSAGSTSTTARLDSGGWLSIYMEFTDTASAVTIVTPHSGEVWHIGSAYTIQWHNSDASSSSRSVQLYTNPVGSTNVCLIANSVPDTGSYTWTIPTSLDKNCWGSHTLTVLRLDGSNVKGQSASFTISSTTSAMFKISEIAPLASPFAPGSAITVKVRGLEPDGTWTTADESFQASGQVYTDSGPYQPTLYSAQTYYDSATGWWNTTVPAPSVAGTYKMRVVIWCGFDYGKACSDRYGSGGPQVEQMVPFTVGATSASVITNLQATPSGTSAVITWSTSVPTNSMVMYVKDSLSSWSWQGADTPLTTTHSVVLPNLEANSLYSYYVNAKDAAGNITKSNTLSFSTGAVGPTGAVDLKVNNSDNPTDVPYNSVITASWSSTGADYCIAHGMNVPLVQGGLWGSELPVKLQTSGSRQLYARWEGVDFYSPLEISVECFTGAGQKTGSDTIKIVTVKPSGVSMTWPLLAPIAGNYAFKLNWFAAAAGVDFLDMNYNQTIVAKDITPGSSTVTVVNPLQAGLSYIIFDSGTNIIEWLDINSMTQDPTTGYQAIALNKPLTGKYTSLASNPHDPARVAAVMGSYWGHLPTPTGPFDLGHFEAGTKINLGHITQWYSDVVGPFTASDTSRYFIKQVTPTCFAGEVDDGLGVGPHDAGFEVYLTPTPVTSPYPINQVALKAENFNATKPTTVCGVSDPFTTTLSSSTPPQPTVSLTDITSDAQAVTNGDTASLSTATDAEQVSLQQRAQAIISKIAALQAELATITPQLKDFIALGTPTTQKLGQGERAGVVSSFTSAFGKAPSTQADMEDVIKIANGRWPTQRNPDKETKAADAFKKIYLRAPDLSNAHDNAAVTVMTYGLRPADRNLGSEAAATKSFTAIYGHAPTSAADWDKVRATAYSGATRQVPKAAQ